MNTPRRLLTRDIAIVALSALPPPSFAVGTPIDQQLASLPLALRFLAIALGLAATAAFPLTLILAARLPPIERVFAGLDRV